jgi:L-malate glycosyltransferase
MYAAADCVIGTGRIALEAMACQRPVVAVGSKSVVGYMTPQNIKYGWESWFGDHGFHKELTQESLLVQIRQVLTQPDETLQVNSWALRNVISQNFDISSAVRELAQLYLDIADQQGRIRIEKE